MDPASYNNFSAPGSSPVPTPQQPVISSGGDIILQSEKPKKRKGLVILLVVLVVLIIGLVAAFYFVNKNRQSGLGANEQAQEAFNRYANFLLYGENKNGSLGDYNKLKMYQVEKEFEIDDLESKMVYFASLNSLYENFLNSYNQKLDVWNEPLKNSVDYYSEIVKFTMSFYKAMDVFDEETIYERYALGNLDDAKKDFNVADFTESKIVDYVTMRDKYIDDYNNLLGQYARLGCLESDNCTMTEETAAISNQILGAKNGLERLQQDFLVDLVRDCWGIEKQLNDVGVSNE